MEEAKESLRAACACGDLAAIRRILSENETLLNQVSYELFLTITSHVLFVL
jgi:hypothetical protein